MKAFSRLIIGIFLLAALMAAVAFALPQQVAVARSTVINAPEGDIFPFLNNPRNFNKWSPWAAKDPNTKYEFSGPEAGIGAKMSWKSDSPDVGQGSQEIIEIEPNASVKIALDFGEMGPATASYVLRPSGAGTEVQWHFETDMGNNPLMRWMGLMLDRWVGKDYEAGLKRLKTLVESGAS